MELFRCWCNLQVWLDGTEVELTADTFTEWKCGDPQWKDGRFCSRFLAGKNLFHNAYVL